MKKYLSIISALTVSVLLWSCSEKEGWTIEGSLQGGNSTMLYLEGSGVNGWYVMDSTELDEDGEFEFTQPVVGYPEVFRLRANDRVVYFPIDSAETITFKGYAMAIDSAYTLKGSTMAEMMMTIDKKIAATVAKGGEKALATDTLLKRELSGMILGDQNGLLSYYIINKRVGNTLIFDANNKADLRVIGAVANKFAQHRPTDPRAESLKKLFLDHRRVSTIGEGDTIQVPETSLFEIALKDNKGMKQSLREVASRGNVTILNFTIYSDKNSPLFNIGLNKIYEANKDAGLEIFQVSVDENEKMWKDASENLPWITVYNSQADGAKYLMNYNVELLPTSFIINRNGELVERVDDINQLEKAVKKYL